MAGYDGYSMSNNARIAYQLGEKPKSRWTKTTIIEYLEELCEEEDRVLRDDVRKMKRDDLFEKYFYKSSWHHTSKKYNKTDFYSFDFDRLDEISREKTEEELQAKQEKAKREREEEERERAKTQTEIDRQNAIREADAELYRLHGCRYDTAAGYAILFPDEMETRTSKKGAIIYRHKNDNTSAWKEATGRYYTEPYRSKKEVEEKLLYRLQNAGFSGVIPDLCICKTRGERAIPPTGKPTGFLVRSL